MSQSKVAPRLRPHIKLVRSSGQWKCYGGGVTCIAEAPAIAYARWLTAKHNRAVLKDRPLGILP